MKVKLGAIGTTAPLTEPVFIPTVRVSGVKRVIAGDEVHLIYYADVPILVDGGAILEHQVVARVVWNADVWAAQMSHIRAEGVGMRAALDS